VGDKNVVLGRFEVQTDSVEDQTLYSVTMEQNGSANDGAITNLKVRRTDGTVLTNTVATTNGGFATFVFDPPFTVLEGDRITLEVVGDVNGGAGDDVQMHFEEASDVFAVGSLYGYGVNGQLYGSRVSLSTAATAMPIDPAFAARRKRGERPKYRSSALLQPEELVCAVRSPLGSLHDKRIPVPLSLRRTTPVRIFDGNLHTQNTIGICNDGNDICLRSHGFFAPCERAWISSSN
jgi:hypothetical protein